MSRKYYRFLMDSSSDLPDWTYNREDCFAIEEEGENWLYVPATDVDAKKLAADNAFTKYEPVALQEVDWNAQWAENSPDFKDQMLQVDLSKYSSLHPNPKMLYLHAGPGFGDLSHSTTRLTLMMMADHVKGKTVVDIGCGSGILTVASILLGAERAIGIDIEDVALTHARENAELNGVESRMSFVRPEQFHEQLSSCVILMNMIRTQQQAAWASLPDLHGIDRVCFSSGVLAQERETYIEECRQRGWVLINECQAEEWLGFRWEMGKQ